MRAQQMETVLREFQKKARVLLLQQPLLYVSLREDFEKLVAVTDYVLDRSPSGEMVDAGVSNTLSEWSAGSNPASGTTGVTRE